MELRIVTNGLNYRIQRLGRTFLLRRPKWYWVRRYHVFDDYIPDFNSEEDAKKAMKTAKAQFNAQERGYQAI